MLFDSHCHLDRIDLGDFNHDFDSLMATIADADVGRMVCIGVDLESFEAMYQRVYTLPNVFCSVGVHPGYPESRKPTVGELCDLAARDKIVAIGETGLDYFHQSGDLSWQRERFITHIEAARTCGLPLIIHTREAREDTIKLLAEHGAAEVGGVMHCFTESWEMAQQAIELGFYISISGIVTFKQASNVQEMASKIPLERLLIETDSPWLSPVPFRGKQNHPGRVGLVAQKLSEIRQESVAQIVEATWQNASRLFNLPADSSPPSE